MRTLESGYHVSGAKALIGAMFIEYLFYGVLYIIEGAKLESFEAVDDVKSPPKGTVGKPAQEHK
jgi:hypothetical protein